MTTSTRESQAGVITRCAVCKVDLKGRFVFIDECTEQLLGCPSEDLFGKPLADFLDKPSAAVVTEILTRRNHYETFYDSTALTLIDKNHRAIRLNAIVSLNFNAGNPVNFQWIFQTDQPVIEPEPTGDTADYRRFVNFLTTVDICADWHGFLQHIKRFAGAKQAHAYIVSGDKLEHRAGAAEPGSPKPGSDAVSEPGPIHLEVARSGQIFDFTDEDCVRKAVELDSLAPNEILGRLAFDDDSTYLIRLQFDNELDNTAIAFCADRSRFALSLAQRLVAPPEHAAATREAEAIRFTIGALDGFGIGAILTDSRGKITAYNPAIANLLENDDIDGDISDLAVALADPFNEAAVLDLFHPSETDENTPPSLLPVALPNGNPGLLGRLALSDSPDDLTAVVALVPAADGLTAADLTRFWTPVIQSLQSSLNVTGSLVRDLSRAAAGDLNDKSRGIIENLSDNIDDTAGALDNLHQVLTTPYEQSNPELTDLGQTVHRVINMINGRHPETPLAYNGEKLPKINARRRAVDLILENLLLDIARHGGNRAPVKINAEIAENICTMNITSVGYTGPLNADCTGLDSHDNSETPESRPALGIAAARLLVRQLGGRFTCEANDDTTVFTLVVPTAAHN